MGVGGAMRFGFRYAVEHGYDVVIQIDADRQHDPAYIPQLLEKVAEGFDLVIGARFAGEGNYKTRGPRRWAMTLLSRILSRITRVRLTDTTSGLRATGPQALPFMAREYPHEYLGDTVESLLLASRAGLRIAQIPVVMRARQGGAPSHQPIRAALLLLRVLLAMTLAALRTHPKAAVAKTPKIQISSSH